MEQNYRSTATILEAANGLIARNAGRLGKNLWTEGERGEPITLYAGFNEQDEARYIVEQAETWFGDGHPRRSIAILIVRTPSRGCWKRRYCGGHPVPNLWRPALYERLEIRNALAYLRLAQTRDDDPALERVLNTPPRGIGSKTVEKIREVARAEQIPMWQAIHRTREQSLLPARALTALGNFQALIDDFDRSSETLPLDELTQHVIEVSGLLNYHRSERGERGQARVENLQELVTAARLFEPEDEEISPLQAFLDSAALDAGEGQADPYEDIQMMTLHSAKVSSSQWCSLPVWKKTCFRTRCRWKSPAVWRKSGGWPTSASPGDEKTGDHLL